MTASDRCLTLIAAGFQPVQAHALAAGGYDVVDWWPLGWQGRDDPLSFFGSEPRCNSTAVFPADGAS